MPDPLDWLSDALADLDARGLRRMLTSRHSPQRGDQIVINGQTLVNFGSNDYLGLATDPRIAAAVKAAVDQYGWGSGASPLVTGRSDLHAELERRLAEFEGTEAALLFPTGYAANVGTITALVGKGDVIYSDELNHASIIDGCRLSGAAVQVYRHCNTGQLEELLQQGLQYRRRLIVTDSLFSMHGDFAPLDHIVRLANTYEAMLLVDEAHATAVFGERVRVLDMRGDLPRPAEQLTRDASALVVGSHMHADDLAGQRTGGVCRARVEAVRVDDLDVGGLGRLVERDVEAVVDVAGDQGDAALLGAQLELPGQ